MRLTTKNGGPRDVIIFSNNLLNNTPMVGIGVETYSANLQVSGSVIISNTTQATNQPSLFIPMSGNIGVGTNDPQAKMDVSGTVKVAGTGAEVCGSDQRGSIRLNPTTGAIQVCRQ